MKAATASIDYIIDTVSAVHPLAPLLNLLKTNGKLVQVGLPEKPLELPMFPLALGRRLVGGSQIGGLKETQEMLDFAAEHGIVADIELIKIDYNDEVCKGIQFNGLLSCLLVRLFSRLCNCCCCLHIDEGMPSKRKAKKSPPLDLGTNFVKLTSWNVNGLRALLKLDSFSAFAQRENFDILCL